MSNTAHQRQARDLERAGLNRILGVSQSGASTPSNTAPKVDNELQQSAAITSQGAMQIAQIKNIEANTANTLEQTKLIAPKAFLYDELLTLAKDFKTWIKSPGTTTGLSEKARGTIEQIGINLGISKQEVKTMLIKKFKTFKGTAQELQKAFDKYLAILGNKNPQSIKIRP